MVITRRNLALTGLGVLPVVRWLGCPPRVQADTPAVRYDVASAQGRLMLGIYAAAVGKMMAMPEGDPRSWQFQWYTHFVRGDRTKRAEIQRVYPNASDPNRALAIAMWSTCQAHSGQREDFFLPWHRMYVLYFERIVRAVSGEPSFTLPYWNYTDPSQRALPAAFVQPSGSSNPLYRPSRRQTANQGAPIDQGPVPLPLDLTAMMSPGYSDSESDAGFCSNLDNDPHGSIHVMVGDQVGMGQVPWAANDPIFWLHHCNIDRIWASWNKAGGANPSDQEFLDKTFDFTDADGRRVRPAPRIGDVLDTVQLGYVYDSYLDRPPGSVPFPTGAAPVVATLASHAASLQASGPVSLGAEPVTVALAAPQATTSGAAAAFGARLQQVPSGQPIYLRLSGVRAASQPDVGYDVYLDLPAGARPDRGDPSYVGAVNFFSAVLHAIEDEHGGSGMNMSGRDVSFVVTAVVRRLRAAGRLTAAPNVTLVPTGAPSSEARPTIGNVALVSS